jgi:hypothetical protein
MDVQVPVDSQDDDKNKNDDEGGRQATTGATSVRWFNTSSRYSQVS